MLTRRQALKLGLLTGTAVALPAVRVIGAPDAKAATGAVGPFSVPLRIPPVLRPVASTPALDIYRMTMRESDVEILPGTRTRLRTFNGEFPGPTIRARRNRAVLIRQVNDLGVHTAVHLHGGHNPATADGHPLDIIEPSKGRNYWYPNHQAGATLWYHDHAMHGEAENIYRGLSGCYILSDDHEDRLRLPKGQYDVPLVLRDAQIEADGTLVWDLHGFRNRKAILVNGRPQPYFQVAARKYRFRLLNAANERVFFLRLRDGGAMTQIASDGGLLEAPLPMTIVPIWPAERAEVVIDFSRYPVGSQIVLENAAFMPGESSDVLRFDVVREAEDNSRVPDVLRRLPSCGTPVVEREFALKLDLATGQWLINGQPFNPDRVDIRPKLGTTEIWKITNNDTGDAGPAIPHSFHTHLVQFRVLDRNGQPPPAHEAGLKDTVSVQPRETVRIKLKFDGYVGRFVYHCHLVSHSMQMMGQMEVVR